jgi:hypothetical protein
MTTRTRQQGLNQNEPLVRRGGEHPTQQDARPQGVSMQHNETLIRRGIQMQHNETVVRR